MLVLYAQCTHSVRTVYRQCTVSVRTVYARYTHSIHPYNVGVGQYANGTCRLIQGCRTKNKPGLTTNSATTKEKQKVEDLARDRQTLNPDQPQPLPAPCLPVHVRVLAKAPVKLILPEFRHVLVPLVQVVWLAITPGGACVSAALSQRLVEAFAGLDPPK